MSRRLRVMILEFTVIEKDLSRVRRGLYVFPRIIRKQNVVIHMDEKKGSTGPLYECVKCGNRVYLAELEKYVSFRCPECGYRIFKKVRPSIVKRVKAR